MACTLAECSIGVLKNGCCTRCAFAASIVEWNCNQVARFLEKVSWCGSAASLNEWNSKPKCILTGILKCCEKWR